MFEMRSINNPYYSQKDAVAKSRFGETMGETAADRVGPLKAISWRRGYRLMDSNLVTVAVNTA